MQRTFSCKQKVTYLLHNQRQGLAVGALPTCGCEGVAGMKALKGSMSFNSSVISEDCRSNIGSIRVMSTSPLKCVH